MSSWWRVQRSMRESITGLASHAVLHVQVMASDRRGCVRVSQGKLRRVYKSLCRSKLRTGGIGEKVMEDHRM
jgi:hypothetical protein